MTAQAEPKVGPEGPEGPIGPQGDVGPQGPQGDAGVAGPQGPEGIQGPAGPQGPDGAGEMGAQGPAGPQGPEGPAGAQGPQGNVGVAGPQGPGGAQGPQGVQGPKGDTGDPAPATSPAADARYLTRGTNWSPRRQNFRAWSSDPANATAVGQPVGRVQYGRCPIPVDDSGAAFAYIWSWQTALGAGLAGCYMGVYRIDTGLLIAKTVELSATFGANGAQQCPLNPVAGRSMVPPAGQDVIVARLIGAGTTTAPPQTRANLQLVGGSSAGFDPTAYSRAFQGPTGAVDLPDVLPTVAASSPIASVPLLALS